MKVAIVTIGGYPSFGGPAKSVKAFQKALNAEVVVWADPMAFPGETLVFKNATVVRPTTVPGLHQLAYPIRADAQVAEERIADCEFLSCHLFWRWHAPWTEAIARKRGIRFWCVPHGGLDPIVLHKNRLAKTIFARTAGRRFLQHASGMVCATQREYLKARAIMPNAFPYVLPWPLDPEDLRERDLKSRADVRSALGIPPNAICFLFVGRLHTIKRPCETIRAFAESGVPNGHLVMVGPEADVSPESCRELARSLGVGDRVHVVGPAFGRVRRMYSDIADVFISLSDKENYNLAAAEALGAGIPVMLSPGNDLASELSDVGCGWMLSTQGDAARTIQAIARTPASHIEQMGIRGREWAAEHLAFPVFQRRLRNYVDAAAARIQS